MYFELSSLSVHSVKRVFELRSLSIPVNEIFCWRFWLAALLGLKNVRMPTLLHPQREITNTSVTGTIMPAKRKETKPKKTGSKAEGIPLPTRHPGQVIGGGALRGNGGRAASRMNS
jgi:hypothetical protein